MHAFVYRYDEGHRHGAIRFVTPGECHRGEDVEILASRKRVHKKAERRLGGSTRNREPIGEVWLDPERSTMPGTEEKLETAI